MESFLMLQEQELNELKDRAKKIADEIYNNAYSIGAIDDYRDYQEAKNKNKELVELFEKIFNKSPYIYRGEANE